MRTVGVFVCRKRDCDGQLVIKVRYSNGETEEVDTADTEVEARELVSEYRMAFNC